MRLAIGCMYVHVCMSVFVRLSVCLSVCIYVCMCNVHGCHTDIRL